MRESKTEEQNYRNDYWNWSERGEGRGAKHDFDNGPREASRRGGRGLLAEKTVNR